MSSIHDLISRPIIIIIIILLLIGSFVNYINKNNEKEFQACRMGCVYGADDRYAFNATKERDISVGRFYCIDMCSLMYKQQSVFDYD